MGADADAVGGWGERGRDVAVLIGVTKSPEDVLYVTASEFARAEAQFSDAAEKLAASPGTVMGPGPERVIERQSANHRPINVTMVRPRDLITVAARATYFFAAVAFSNKVDGRKGLVQCYDQLEERRPDQASAENVAYMFGTGCSPGVDRRFDGRKQCKFPDPCGILLGTPCGTLCRDRHGAAHLRSDDRNDTLRRALRNATFRFMLRLPLQYRTVANAPRRNRRTRRRGAHRLVGGQPAPAHQGRQRRLSASCAVLFENMPCSPFPSIRIALGQTRTRTGVERVSGGCVRAAASAPRTTGTMLCVGRPIFGFMLRSPLCLGQQPTTRHGRQRRLSASGSLTRRPARVSRTADTILTSASGTVHPGICCARP